MDRKYVVVSFIFAIIGLVLGIFMAASKNHGQFITHAHIMLVGFLLSFIYGLCHKLWLNNEEGTLVKVQFYMHIIGAGILSAGLFLLYGNVIKLEVIDPILGVASITVLVSLVLMLVLFLKSCRST